MSMWWWLAGYSLVALGCFRVFYPRFTWDHDQGKVHWDRSSNTFGAVMVSLFWPLFLLGYAIYGACKAVKFLMWPKGPHARLEAKFKAEREQAEKLLHEQAERERIAKEEGWLST